MYNISSTEFEKKCKEVVPMLQEMVMKKAPNVISIRQFYQLEHSLRLNLCVDYKKGDEEKVLTLSIPAQQVMDENLTPVVDLIVKNVT
ncbi:MAG: hypothetical protein XD50_1049 [Clostridia bacterium 41_269]|nr:MAG: hypothetical protein XD50_1049 [Clostridia bacterium 41_269]